MTLVIHHKSLCSVLSLSNMYLRDPLASDLWDPMAYMSHVLVRPFFISIQHAGPDGLHVMCTYGTIRPMGPDGSCVMCTCGTILHLHPTCGTRWHACHLYLLCRCGLINSKKPQCLGVEPGTRRKECTVFTIALDAWLY